jgi:hypothetical protein
LYHTNFNRLEPFKHFQGYVVSPKPQPQSMKIIAILVHLHDLYGIVFCDLNEQMKLVVQSHAMQHNIISFLGMAQ